MKTSLFLKSRAHDFPWLEYCKRSVNKFCSGFHEIVLALPIGESFDWPEARIEHVEEWEPTYLAQQSFKLYADAMCEGDLILYQDSDTIFDRPVKPEDFLIDGKPYWLLRPFDQARPDQRGAWFGPMTKFMGEEPAFEGMARHPFCVPRGVLKKMRDFCQFKHGVSLVDYIKSQAVPNSPLALAFSEWNSLSQFSLAHCHDQFHWIDLSKEEAPQACSFQGFSHGGEARKQQDIAKFKEILGADDLPAAPVARPVVVSGYEPLTVRSAINFLVGEAHADNFAKARILKNLKAAGFAKGAKLKSLEELPSKPAPAPVKQQGGVLLAIQSYPGANEAVKRHWKFYEKSGATRIVGVGTTDRKCEWPEGCETVNIGKNSYINGPHLPKRLADILEWCLTQPEDWFIVSEYDCCFFNPIKPWTGFCAHLTGGQLPEAKATRFFHPPYLVDREMATVLMHELRAVIQEGHCTAMWPEASPDVALGLVADRLKITPNHNHFTLFSRNSLNAHGDLERAIQAARDNVDAIHGIKSEQELLSITSALKRND